jgi:molybdopterin-containing oxidoreductase family iron-sulfur binding subunit
MQDAGPYRDTIYHEYLQTRWKRELHAASGSPVEFRRFWLAALEAGVVSIATRGPQRLPAHPSVFPDPPASVGSAQTVAMFVEHPFLGDGRFANNGWLQELPHPITRVVWDNYAAVSPGTAASLGVTTGGMVNVEIEGRNVDVPVFVQPGMSDGFVTVTHGHGRWKAGSIGTAVGTDIGGLIPASAVTGPAYQTCRISRREGRHALVSTQEHHALDDDRLKDIHALRKIVREGTVAQFSGDPQFLQHDRPELFSISKEVTYTGVKWAMAIDMNKCVGCAACVTACNVENNVPVVGKEQVALSREMQWIRIDRYFSGTAEDPTSSHQPMLCQHCDNAPCENVCPTVATNHSPDGLNQMVYNRCVGTKYCSNNCPYKVRRFNFLDYRDDLAGGYQEHDLLSLLHNPEVTVRSRGVMEKCTFCLQRIMEARQHASEEGRELRGSDVRTACQEACPARAIVFGDMNDENSEVSLYRKHPLGYHVLEEINVRPNVTYLARLRNIATEARS